MKWMKWSMRGLVNRFCGSVAQSCLTLCDAMDCSRPGFPVLHHLLEFAQTHVHWVDDAIQSSHPLVNSKSSINGRYCSFCCLWEASRVNTDSPFLIGLPRWRSGEGCTWMQQPQETRVWSRVGKIPWRRGCHPLQQFHLENPRLSPELGGHSGRRLPLQAAAAPAAWVTARLEAEGGRRWGQSPSIRMTGPGQSARTRPSAPLLKVAYGPARGLERAGEQHMPLRGHHQLPTEAQDRSSRSVTMLSRASTPREPHNRPGRQPWHVVLGTSVTSQVLAAPGPPCSRL